MSQNQFHRNHSGQLTFEMSNVPARSYAEMCADISSRFRLNARGGLVSDLVEVVFEDYGWGELRIGLEWDIWSGFIVVAKNPDSEQLVRDIADYLSHSPWAEVQNP